VGVDARRSFVALTPLHSKRAKVAHDPMRR
jgi:hypothetical protein